MTVESFFALLQKNVLSQWEWVARQQWRLETITWIDTVTSGNDVNVASESRHLSSAK